MQRAGWRGVDTTPSNVRKRRGGAGLVAAYAEIKGRTPRLISLPPSNYTRAPFEDVAFFPFHDFRTGCDYLGGRRGAGRGGEA